MKSRSTGFAVLAHKNSLLSCLALVVASFLSTSPLHAQEPDPRLNPGVFEDCNENGVPDDLDIRNGTSLDIEPNGIPDDCQTNGGILALPAQQARTVARMQRFELEPATLLRPYPLLRIIEYRVLEYRDRVVIVETSRPATHEEFLWLVYGF